MAQSFAFAVFATLICQINIVFPCKDTKAAFPAKTQKLQKATLFALFGLRRILGIVMPVFLWHRVLVWLLLKKQGKLYFFKSSQTKGRDVLAAFATLVCQRNCIFLCKGTKLQKA